MTWLSEAVQAIDAVTAVTPAGSSYTDLVHGSKYLADLYYQDAACNPEQSSGSVEVTFASNFTLAPTLYNPATGSFLADTFKVKYTLLELALEDSVKLTFDYRVPSLQPPPDVCGYGVNDSTSTRQIVLATEAEGQQDINIGALSTASLSEVVSSVTPSLDLVDGACYDVTLEYQDGAGADSASVTHESVRFAGSATLQLPDFVPVPNAKFKEAFLLEFSLLEPAQGGTLKLRIEHSGSGAADPAPARTIVFTGDMLFAGPHKLTFRALTNIAQDVNVQSCTADGGGACSNLVHAAVYTMSLSYQDSVGNPQALLEQEGYTFDEATDPPSIQVPSAATFFATDDDLVFSLPEDGLPGSFALIITAIAGFTRDTVTTREITFSDLAILEGVHKIPLPYLSSLPNENFTSSLIEDLLDGAQYTFTLRYRDAANNDPAETSVSGITFAGNVTQPPTFEQPASSCQNSQREALSS
jgi:hypothetical protein